METLLGLGLIAFVSIWLFQLIDRILWTKWQISLTSRSGPHYISKTDETQLISHEQAARIIWDVSLTMGEIKKSIDRIEKVLAPRDDDAELWQEKFGKTCGVPPGSSEANEAGC